MEEIIKILTWQNIVTFLSLLFGLITLLAYIDQRKSNKENKQIKEFISRHLDRDITKEEINNLSVKKTNLEQEVTNKIPLIGKASILQYQADFHKKEINHNYDSLVEINSQLSEITSKNNIQELSPGISKLILSELFPKFKRDKLTGRIRDRILIYVALILVSEIIFPLGLDNFVKFGVGLLLLWDITIYFTSKVEDSDRRNIYYTYAKYIIMIAGIVTFIYMNLIVVINWEDIFKDSIWELVLVETIGIFGLTIGLCRNIITKVLKNYIERVLDFENGST